MNNYVAFPTYLIIFSYYFFNIDLINILAFIMVPSIIYLLKYIPEHMKDIFKMIGRIIFYYLMMIIGCDIFFFIYNIVFYFGFSLTIMMINIISTLIMNNVLKNLMHNIHNKISEHHTGKIIIKFFSAHVNDVSFIIKFMFFMKNVIFMYCMTLYNDLVEINNSLNIKRSDVKKRFSLDDQKDYLLLESQFRQQFEAFENMMMKDLLYKNINSYDNIKMEHVHDEDCMCDNQCDILNDYEKKQHEKEQNKIKFEVEEMKKRENDIRLKKEEEREKRRLNRLNVSEDVEDLDDPVSISKPIDVDSDKLRLRNAIKEKEQARKGGVKNGQQKQATMQSQVQSQMMKDMMSQLSNPDTMNEMMKAFENSGPMDFSKMLSSIDPELIKKMTGGN